MIACVYTVLAAAVIGKRAEVLRAAHESHPNRFVKGVPRPRALPKEVAITLPRNRPAVPDEATQFQEVAK